MRWTSRTARRATIVAALALVAASAAGSSSADVRPAVRAHRPTHSRWQRFAPETFRIDSLRFAGAIPQALAACDSLRARSDRDHDDDLRIVAGVARGRLMSVLGGGASTRSVLDSLS